VRENSPLPLVADEEAVAGVDVAALATAYDGVNIKLTRLGGLGEAVRTLHAARAAGLDVMLGCFVESSVAITAAAHLAPLARWTDLDGAALLAHDPYRGATVREGMISLPSGDGLGVTPR
jgi:L-Ala-D/L-Glu epimerase